MKKIILQGLIVFSFVFFVVSFLQASSIIAYQVPTGTVGNQDWYGSLGMDFNVNQDIRILSLGAFDSGSNGLSRQITVRLYNRANQSLLAESIFNIGNTGILDGGSRFLDLAIPLTLQSGFQGSIVAFGYGSGEPNGNKGNSGNWFTNDGGGLLSFVGSGRYSGSTNFPTIIDGGPPDRYAAGTFKYEAVTAPIPEPSTVLLIGMGLLGIGVFNMRRKYRK
jgi:hypothetical protein